MQLFLYLITVLYTPILDYFDVVSVGFLFFFFKQKTAYEMRISDWSSDVCSSDLQQLGMALDRVNPPGDPRQDGRLVTRPGADLQNLGAVGQFQRLGHEGDDEGLADGLPGRDRQRQILPGLVHEGGVHEQLARHPLERAEHGTAGDPTAPQATDRKGTPL